MQNGLQIFGQFEKMFMTINFQGGFLGQLASYQDQCRDIAVITRTLGI
jgi:hypothetical protein